MSNNQAAILREGIEVWNQWRRDNRSVEINLRREDLSGMELPSEKHGEKLNLSEVHLEDANLTDADFRYANFTGAHLDRATLTDIDAKGSDFSNAYLVLERKA